MFRNDPQHSSPQQNLSTNRHRTRYLSSCSCNPRGPKYPVRPAQVPGIRWQEGLILKMELGT
ncbi:unnamed protein product [Penicillium roqueforti FM164]|uniref:Genomic scaffold, ProqFM164S02 n=1 Tax=Penicillium roqueforti (strain FM164) TaxID=1365484 RepID=W6Q552_PENRF|nr:unnamed protein product [Penicillium roqueforti FM164]